MAAVLSPVKAWLNGLEPGVFDGLTPEQITFIHDSITETLGIDPTPEKLGDAVESASPELAASFRGRTPQENATYVHLVLAVLQIILTIYQVAGAVTPAQVTQIINNIETTVVNVTQAPPPPRPAPEIRQPAPEGGPEG